MAVTENSYTGNGSTTNYSFTFEYLKSTDIQVQVDATVTTAWTLANATTVQFNTAPSNGAAIKILRDTNIDNLSATFYAGSAIKSEDLNDNFTQSLYVTQETGNRSFENTGTSTMIGNLNMGEDTSIVFEGATDNAHEIKLSVADPTADRTITLPNVTGTVVTTGDTGTVTATMLAANSVDSSELVDGGIDEAHLSTNSVATSKIQNDAITGAKIADNVIDSEHYVDGSIDGAHLATNSIEASKIQDNTISHAKLQADIIDSDNIQDDAINSEHYVDGSIDTVHIGDDQVTAAKLANTSVSAGSYTAADITVDAQGRLTSASNGSISTDEIANNAVTTAKIADSQVITDKIANSTITGAKIQDDSIDSGHYVNSSIDGVHISDNSIDSGHYVDGSIDREHLSADIIDATKIADDAVTTDHIADAELVTLAGMQNGTASKLAGGTALTADLADLNQVDGLTKQTTISDSDASFPTSGAVVDYVAAQIGPIGGLEVIATDAAFPNTQPAAGVVISIADAGGLVVNGSGTSTTGRTVGSSTVTINNINSQFNNTTVDAGVAMMVSSTGSGQIYNYHKATLKEADLLSLSGDINDFAERYRVAGSAPSSSLDEGDLWWDSSTDKLKVYDGSSWEEVASSGDFYINTISSYSGTGGNSASFNGSAYRFVLSNPGSSAQQHVVSINGVIQKPNSGTSQPSEGFVIDGTSIIFSNAPATGSDYFILTLGSTVSIGTPSDNTVSTTKIQNLAVNGDKIANDTITEAKLDVSNAPTNGQYLQAQSGEGGGLTWATVDTSTLLPLAGGTLTGDVTFNGDNYNLMWDKSANSLEFWDNAKLTFGDPGGTPDIQIYHDGSHSWIKNATGDLIVNAANFYVNNAGQTETMIKASENGSCDLYYDNVKKLTTYSSGIEIHGSEGANCELYLYADEGDDDADNWKITTLAASSTYQLQNRASGSWETNIECNGDGNVELYHDNTKRFETTSMGGHVLGVSTNTDVGYAASQVFEINNSSDANNNHTALSFTFAAQDRGAAIYAAYRNTAGEADIILAPEYNEKAAIFKPHGAVELNYDNAKKFETVSGGATVTGALTTTGNVSAGNDLEITNDSGKIKLGTGGDIEIYADGSNSYMDHSGDGDLRIRSLGSAEKIELLAAGSVNLKVASGAEYALSADANGSVELYYDNTKKFNTTDEGAVITSGFQGTGGPGILKLQTGGGAQNQEFLACYYNDSTLAGGLRRNGTGQNVELFQGSDSRLKKDIADMPAILSKLNQIKLKTYKYKDDNSATGSGPLAQELVSIFPEKVAKTDDGTGDTIPSGVAPWTVGKDFTWELIKAVQELSAKNTALEARIATLEAA